MRRLVLLIAVFLSLAGTAAVTVPAQASPETITDARCDYWEGFLCIVVNGHRGEYVIAGVTYSKTDGPRRIGYPCYKTPAEGWTCGDPWVIETGNLPYSFPFGTLVIPGCYQAALVTDVAVFTTECLWR